MWAVSAQPAALPSISEITYAAVHPGRRRQGIGSVVLRRVLTDLGASGVALVEVKTLDESAGHEPLLLPADSGKATASSKWTASIHFRAGNPGTPLPST